MSARKLYETLSAITLFASYIALVWLIVVVCGNYVVDAMFWIAMLTCIYPLLAGLFLGACYEDDQEK